MKKNVYENLLDIIYEATKYIKTYSGIVINNADPSLGGKVQVSIPELDWITPDVAPWCSPRLPPNQYSAPLIGTWVEVGFSSGDVDQPYFTSSAGNVARSIPLAYAGNPAQHIIFQSPVQKQAMVTFDDVAGLMSLISGAGGINLMAGTEPIVLGTQLMAFLTAIVGIFNNHSHITGAVGTPTSLPALLPLAPPGVPPTVFPTPAPTMLSPTVRSS